MDWFLYDNGLRHERVNIVNVFMILLYVSYHIVNYIYFSKATLLFTIFSGAHTFLRKLSLLFLAPKFLWRL